MNNNIEKFYKFTLKTEKEDEKYENFNITAENFKFPYIYLTEEEIIEFNEECEKSGLDLRVSPLSDYMKYSFPNKGKPIINDNMKIINNAFLQRINDYEEDKKNLNIDYKYKYVNEFIGKKHRKYDSDDDSNDKNNDKRSSFSNKSNININRIKLEKLKLDKAKRKGKSQNVKIKVDEERNIKNKKNKKKQQKKDNCDINMMNKLFAKIKDSAVQKRNEIEIKRQLIKEILEISHNLTKEGLKDLSIKYNIRLVGDQFSVDALGKKNNNQLKNVLFDIKTNSRLYKLESNRKDSIKTIKNKEEWERKSYEKALKKKMMIEEYKKKQIYYNNNKKVDKAISDESQSEMSYDDDSLN